MFISSKANIQVLHFNTVVQDTKKSVLSRLACGRVLDACLALRWGNPMAKENELGDSKREDWEEDTVPL